MSKKITSVTVPLDYPVVVEGREYDQLTFRRMKARDTLLAEDESNQARAGFLMFAALAGVDVAVIEELDLADLETIGEKVVPLMGKSGVQILKELEEPAQAFDGAT
ncbi:MAG: phage tail assembly protein [Rhizobiaceae bacterium]|nr:phage tail assembly protein [Rhizobiaceae bacterium]